MANLLYPVPSTEKIFATGDPRRLEEPVLLFSGDVAHLSLCYRTERDYQYGSLALSGGAAARAITVERIGLVPAINAIPHDADDYYIKRDDRLYPDVLEEVDIRRIQSQRDFNQGFFLTVKDSERIPVGDHTVRVTARINGEIVAKTSFVIRKLPYTLPEQKCISTCWMHYDSFIVEHNVKLFTKEFYKIFGSYLDAAVYSGQSMLLVPVFTPAFDTEPGTERLTAQLVDIREDSEGNFSFDFARLREFVAFASAHGIKYLEIPPLFTQWGAKHAPKILVRGENGRLRRRFGWETDSLSDDYRHFVESFVPALVAELREIGMEESTFFHVSDEPGLDHLERWMACKAMIMPLIGNCRTLDACANLEFAGKSDREYTVCAENHVDKFIEAGIRPLCTYFCCSQRMGYMPNRFLAMPLSRMVILGALLYKYDFDLFLQWGFNFYNTFLSRRHVDPYGNTDCDVHYPAGDAFIVYPDRYRKGCRKSIRLVATREAFRLSRILALLEEKRGRDVAMGLLDELGILDFAQYPRKEGIIETLVNRAVALLDNA